MIFNPDLSKQTQENATLLFDNTPLNNILFQK